MNRLLRWGLHCVVAGLLIPVAVLASAQCACAAEPDAPKAAAVATATPAAAPLSGKALEQAARAALRKAAQAQAAQLQAIHTLDGQPLASIDEALVRQLVDLYRQVAADQSLPRAQRDGLRLALRSRLLRMGTDLRANEKIAVAPKAQGLQPARPNVQPQVLAQLGGGQAAGGGAAPPIPPSLGQELADLIEETIAPATWDSVGGPGVIRFWAPGSALVIRHTGEVHGDAGQLIRDLR